ncbi:CYTH and CHAD domain-containing protein [Aquincola sp. MAHUQ-54]|uniref:CYTH and CHAD domain-containing protein n=1 Tax=Aquincola agrisoli TaxID=3119538 RepID=A0AAW9QNN8_9BURK
MSQEIELKFGFAPAALSGLVAALSGEGARRERLQAHYFDTPDRLLARHRIALRLRKEGRRWVQTLKAQGASVVQRLEDNAVVPAPRGGGVPALDVGRHDGSPAGDALAAVLRRAAAERDNGGTPPQAPATLQAVYGTDLWRRTRVIDLAGGRIEAALDEGHILSGGERLAVCELELELADGSPAALQALAAEWVSAHGLWLSHATKAERGERLAQGLPLWPVVKAGTPGGELPPDADRWVRDSITRCLGQIVPNADALASGHGGPEHVHQLRVGLRRLRTVLRELQGVEAGEALREAFGMLGRWRDRDEALGGAAAALALSGAPPITMPQDGADVTPPNAVAGAAAFQQALVALTVAGLQPAGESPLEAPPRDDHGPRALAARRLKKLHRRVLRDADGFESLPAEAQHRVRKRVKRLRYLAEFAAPAFEAAAVRRYLKRLAPAQEALGQLNDQAVALDAYRRAAEAGNAEAWYAVGWLQARRAPAVHACRQALRKLGKAKRFW